MAIVGGRDPMRCRTGDSIGLGFRQPPHYISMAVAALAVRRPALSAARASAMFRHGGITYLGQCLSHA